MTLPKEVRIKSKKDFERIFKMGRAVKNEGLLVKFLENQLAFNRGTVVVPMAISSQAVERNYLKRLISEALKPLLKVSENYLAGQGKKFVDVLVLAQSGIKNKKLSEITAILRNIFQKANIV